jgi:hypothetical protein
MEDHPRWDHRRPAPAQHSRPEDIANRCRNVILAARRTPIESAAESRAPGESRDASQSE